MNKSKEDLILRRRQTIQILYRLFLFEEDTLRIKQEVLDGFQLETFDEELTNYIIEVLDNWLTFKDLISNLLPKTWKWFRLPKIVQAILVNACFEVKFEITPKAVVINESIEITREYLPSFDTSFINGLLDNIN